MRDRLENYLAVRCEHKELQSMRAALLARYDKVLETTAAELLAIETAIECLPDPTQRRLLRLHYINGLPWRAVSDRMHYSRKQIYNLKEQALGQLEAMNLLDAVEPRD